LEEGATNDKGEKINFEFVNNMVGTNIPPEYIPSCAKGFNDAMEKGGMIGASVQGVRVVLTDGQTHAVDSSDMAFRICAAAAVRTAMPLASPAVLEPVMSVEITGPADFQGSIVGGVNRRMGVIQHAGMSDDGTSTIIKADVPLASMFGYSTELRSMTQGKGEFSMEYKLHQPVTRDVQDKLVEAYQKERAADN